VIAAQLQAKLTRLAHERGTDPRALAREAIERLVDYDDCFLRDVDKALVEVERG
jgi:predicted transcriptional regulator